MSQITLLSSFLLFVACTHAEQNWYSLQTTWAPLPFQGFFNQPRTEAEALEAGWTQVSNDCSGGAFPGNRYTDPEMHMVLIYDVNGFIAGMHSVVDKSKTEGNPFDFANNKWYRTDTINGVEAYVTTAYFVDPAVICTGRSQGEFDQEGTGNRLLFQNGPTSSDTVSAPLTIEDADTNVSKE